RLSGLLEGSAQLEIIIDLAVVGQHAQAGGERLVGARIRINDGEPRVQQMDMPTARGSVVPISLGIRSAPAHERERRPNTLGRHLRGTVVPGDPAHGLNPPDGGGAARRPRPRTLADARSAPLRAPAAGRLPAAAT